MTFQNSADTSIVILSPLLFSTPDNTVYECLVGRLLIKKSLLERQARFPTAPSGGSMGISERSFCGRHALPPWPATPAQTFGCQRYHPGQPRCRRGAYRVS